MKKPDSTPPTKAKTLVQQNTDFTAEGSPPPGKVATEVPASAPAVPSTQGEKTAKNDSGAKNP